MSHTKSKSGSPRFQVGNKVRVKYGVIDPDFQLHIHGGGQTVAPAGSKIVAYGQGAPAAATSWRWCRLAFR